jgi:hypothetical protein
MFKVLAGAIGRERNKSDTIGKEKCQVIIICKLYDPVLKGP